MAIIKHLDKRSGVTYVYSSESYWDKEKGQPRSHRKLIGKIDDATGEIVPTGKSGRKKAERKAAEHSAEKPITAEIELLAEKDELIKELKAENAALKKEKAKMLSALRDFCSRLED